MNRRIWLSMILVAILLNAGAAIAMAVTETEIRAIRDRLRGQSVELLASPNRSVTVFAPGAPSPCYAVYASGAFLPPVQALPAEIVDLKSVRGGVELRLKHARQGSGKILLMGQTPAHEISASCVEQLLRLLIVEPGKKAPYAYVLNLSSQVIHIRGANHLPTDAEQRPLDRLPSAPSDGAHLCSSCFRPNPRISDYDTEVMLGRAWAAEVRGWYPVVIEDEISRRVRTAGKAVLMNWPTQLRGYSYEFTVIRSPEPNAFACPAGEIFITTGMLETMESADELTAVIAREIAHVERRHGYRQYQREIRTQSLSLVAGMAVGLATEDFWATSAALSLSALAGAVTRASSARTEESEADTYAAAILGRTNAISPGMVLTRVLAKLQQWSAITSWAPPASDVFATYPLLHNRMEKARSAQMISLEGPHQFLGMDAGGDAIAILNLDGLAHFDYEQYEPPYAGVSRGKPLIGSGLGELKRVQELELLATVRSTTALAKAAKLKSITLIIGGTRINFDNREDTELFPADEAGMNFTATDRKMPPPLAIEGVDLDIPGVAKWVPVEPLDDAPAGSLDTDGERE